MKNYPRPESSAPYPRLKTAFITFSAVVGLGLGPLALHAQADASTKGEGTTEEVLTLSPFEVTSKVDRGYGSRSAMGASRIALSLLETSASVVTLNETFMRDAAMVDARDVLQFVSGAQTSGSSTVTPGQVETSIRGYTSGVSMRDGLPDAFAAGDVINQEGSGDARIEVIKGPAGTLYGSHSMGGIVNIVSKWPEFTRKTRLELQAQSFEEFARGVLDTTGPIGKSTAYRVVLSERVGQRFYDNEKDAPNDFFAANMSLMRVWEGGRAWARFRYLNVAVDRGQGPQALTGYLTPGATQAPVVTNPVFSSAADLNTMPEDDISKANIGQYEAGLEQALNKGGNPWTIRLVGRFGSGHGDTSPSYAAAAPVPVDAQGRIVTYVNANGVTTNGNASFISALDPRVADWRSTVTVRDFIGSSKNGGAYMDLVGGFETGFLKHKLLVTSSLARSSSQRAFFFWALPNPANTTAVANSFSVARLDPALAAIRAADIFAAPTGRQFNAFNGEAEATRFSGGLQDNISLLRDRLILTFGARYDNAHLSNRAYNAAASLAAYELVSGATAINSVAQDWSFKGGGVYKINRGISLFGQVSETFNPVTSINATTGQKNPNQNGRMKEAGVNVELFDARLVATASVFDMELTNVLIQVVNPPELGGGFIQVPAGVQKTDGFELDLSCQPVKGLNLMLAYSDVTSKNATGGYFRNVPIDPTWSLFARYEFLQGRLRGWFAGANLKHIGKQAGDAANTFFLDSADEVGGLLGYKAKTWSVQLNAYNLFNSDDIVASVSATDAFRMAERHYRLTLRYEF